MNDFTKEKILGHKVTEVEGMVRSSIPTENENIVDDLGIDTDKLKEWCNSIANYKRSKEECPLGRGNWIIDFMKDGVTMFCVKLPYEMTRAQIDKFCEPLWKIYGISCVETSEGLSILPQFKGWELTNE